MIKRYLGVCITVLVFCLQIDIHAQVVSTKGVDFSSQRLSFFEQDQDRGLKAYARARLMLTDEDSVFQPGELLSCLSQALSFCPGDEELLSLLIARHLHHQTPAQLYSDLRDLGIEVRFSPAFIEGAGIALSEFLKRPDLALRLLSDELSRRGWQDSGQPLMSYLFRLMSLCLEQRKELDRVEELLGFLEPDYKKYLSSPGDDLLFLDTVLQYRLYLASRRIRFSHHWDKIADFLRQEVWKQRRLYVSEEHFYSMIRVLAMDDANQKMGEFLQLPEIRKKYGETRTWRRFTILSAAILDQTALMDLYLEKGLKDRVLTVPELFSIGAACSRKNRLKPSLLIYQNLLEQLPRSAKIRLILARLYYLADQPVKGIEILRPVNPLTVDGCLILAYLWQKMDNEERAWHFFQTAENLFRKKYPRGRLDAGFYISAGLCAYKTGKKSEAVRLLREAWKRAPGDVNISNSLGYVLADYGIDLEQAEKLLDYALKHSGKDNYAVRDSVAWLYFRQNRLQEAAAMMTAVLKNASPELLADPEIRLHAHEIFKKMGFLKLAEFFRP